MRFRDHRFCSRQRSGFNLVEAAIVLGIVGLVIGGIWVAATSVQRENRRTQIKTAILEMRSRVNAVWGTQRPPFNNFPSLTEGIYPDSVIATPAQYASIQSNGDFTYVHPNPAGFYSAINANSNNAAWYAILGIDKSDCIWMAYNMFTLFPDDGGSDGAHSAHVSIGPSGGTPVWFAFDPPMYWYHQGQINSYAEAGCAQRNNMFLVRTGWPG